MFYSICVIFDNHLQFTYGIKRSVITNTADRTPLEKNLKYEKYNNCPDLNGDNQS